jgi:hypothetical protein
VSPYPSPHSPLPFPPSDNDSDEEEGAINSNINSETVYFNSADVGDDQDILRIMGFSGFDSTKEKPVDDNHQGSALGAVSKHKKRVYRQYMNRRGEPTLFFLPLTLCARWVQSTTAKA